MAWFTRRDKTSPGRQRPQQQATHQEQRTRRQQLSHGSHPNHGHGHRRPSAGHLQQNAASSAQGQDSLSGVNVLPPAAYEDPGSRRTFLEPQGQSVSVQSQLATHSLQGEDGRYRPSSEYNQTQGSGNASGTAVGASRREQIGAPEVEYQILGGIQYNRLQQLTCLNRHYTLSNQETWS